MFGRARHFLEPELEFWHQKYYDLLLEYLGGSNPLKARSLITPTREFFPATDATGHDRACHIFVQIKILADMKDWPCELEPQTVIYHRSACKCGSSRRAETQRGRYFQR